MFVTEKILDCADWIWFKTAFSSLLEDPSTHDVTFKTSDGGSVSAHRVIVAAGSPVFHAMLYGNMKESSQKEIELPNIDSNMLKMLFYFFYTGHVRASFTKCFELIPVADYFGVAGLVTFCTFVIQMNLTIYNCGDAVALAMKYQLDSVLEKCIRYMEENAYRIVECGSLSGPKPYPLPAVIEFLKSSDLEVNEFWLFDKVNEWRQEMENVLSADDLKSVFGLIRYPLMRKECLTDTVRQSNMADPDLYRAALEYHDTGQYTGPQEQITLRKFYFDFEPVNGLIIEQTPKGTLITKPRLPEIEACYMCLDHSHDYFVFCLKSCADKSKMGIQLINMDNPTDSHFKEVHQIPIGDELHCDVSFEYGYLIADFEAELELRIPAEDRLDLYRLTFHFWAEGDQISILKI